MITKKGNITEMVEIYNKNTNIVISEFIATNFVDKDNDNNFQYWNYLQSRKNYICYGLGVNPYKFDIR